MLVIASIGAAGCVLLALGLLGRWPWLLPWGLAGFGVEYALFLVLGDATADARAPFVAAGLFLVAELAYWSVTGAVAGDRALLVRAVILGAAVVAAIAVVGGVVLLAGGSAETGLGFEAAGVAAAIAAVAALRIVAARSARR